MMELFNTFNIQVEIVSRYFNLFWKEIATEYRSSYRIKWQFVLSLCTEITNGWYRRSRIRAYLPPQPNKQHQLAKRWSVVVTYYGLASPIS
ncbi:hypothetical protein QTP88_013970 [Uroleucon formosanum]